jgi:alpha-tubulin suppressor-like RCC1 family protein
MRTTMTTVVAAVMVFGWTAACALERGYCQGGSVRNMDTGVCECAEGTVLRKDVCVVSDGGVGGSVGVVDAAGRDAGDAGGASESGAAPDASEDSAVVATDAGADAGEELDSAVEPPVRARQVALGDRHACVLLSNGTVVCWGSNAKGESAGAVTREGVVTPTVVPGVENAVQIAAGGDSSCALAKDGSVTCWGEVAAANGGAPSPVPGLSDAKGLSVSMLHGCALRKAGTVVCWGSNGSQQLGVSGAHRGLDPVAVPSVNGATDVATYLSGACVLAFGGSVNCWGSWYDDRGAPAAPTGPTVQSFAPATGVGAGSGNLRCAIVEGGRVSCVGQAYSLGNNSVGASWSSVPTLVTGVSGAVAVVLSGTHACAQLLSGDVYCWGGNDSPSGQCPGGILGTQNAVSVLSVPVLVPGVRGVTSVSTSTDFTCAINGDGQVVCWGLNLQGQLGDPTLGASGSPVVVTLPGQVQ